jgi:hypothetical protein
METNCARIKYNDIKGFADDEYIQDNAYRMCIKCKMQENTLLGFRQKSFAVKGIPMFACNSCGKATELKFEASECVHILPATWVQMSTSFGGGAVKRRCRRCFLKVSHRVVILVIWECFANVYDRPAFVMRRLLTLASLKKSSIDGCDVRCGLSTYSVITRCVYEYTAVCTLHHARSDTPHRAIATFPALTRQHVTKYRSHDA